MKILKLVVSLAVGLVVAFALVGFFVSEVETTSSVDIAAPVDQVWAVYTDESRMGDWIEGFVSIEHISGAPLEVGSRWRLVFTDPGGDEIEMIEEVTAVDPMQRFAIILESDDVYVESDTRFLSDGAGGSRIESTSRMRGKNWIHRSLLALFRGFAQGQQDENFDRLRQLIEDAPPIE